MIFENEDEKNAFKFICELAHESTDRICTDLNPKEEEMFSHLKVEGEDEVDGIIMHEVNQSYDVINWLIGRVK